MRQQGGQRQVVMQGNPFGNGPQYGQQQQVQYQQGPSQGQGQGQGQGYQGQTPRSFQSSASMAGKKIELITSHLI